MSKKRIYIAFIILALISTLYSVFEQKPLEKINEKSVKYVILEGEFKKTGRYEYEKDITIQELIKKVGVKASANKKALNLKSVVVDESHIYMPKKSEYAINLNKADAKTLQILPRIGEKTAEKIIDYRKKKPFERLEEIMEVKGIGDKTFIQLRDYVCL